ncbi:MFS transporter [Catenuloplanes atrovinosus]|uniref:MFS family permease n=1 Tax=Catenuloplanes atrovinosus TaxID=137266 RepID=A0AAE3YYQ3_9ACTN|nr:MFS transporter [Catenuloplanes atrovinosus]MDR7281035.1 MFS family permease [Catenuloplanes atrovinosus]
MSSPLSLLARNPDFRRLYLSELVVFGADWFVMVPLLVLLTELTGSGVLGALVMTVDTGLNALLLPYSGTVVDRVDRRTVMISANLVALAASLLLFTVQGAGTAWLALLAMAAVAVAKSFYTPAAQAALPNVVDPADLPAANALAGGAWGIMVVVGASVGGVLSGLAGPYVCFAVAGAGLLVAAVLTARIRRPLQAASGASPAHPLAAIREALHHIGGSSRLRALITVKSAVGLGNGVIAAFPLVVAACGVGPAGVGILFAVRGAAVLVGPLVTRRLLDHQSWLLPGLAISMGVYGLAYATAAFAPYFPLLVALVFVAHFAGGTNWMLSNFALQGAVPDALRGRVFATDLMLTTIAISISQLGVAAVIDHVSPRHIMLASGAVTLLYACAWSIATRPRTRP